MNYGQPNYYNQGYRPQGFNAYGQPTYMQPQYQTQPQYPSQYQPQTMNQPITQPMYLQGKSVDNVEVVKATDIPLDGSTSYFPLTDGSAIVTKQLQMDGTSKIIVYKPILDETQENTVVANYITIDDLNKGLEKFDNSKILEEMKDLRKEIALLKDSVKETKSTTKKG